MGFEFDNQGHVIWTPKTLYDLAKTAPLQLVNRYLMTGTPWAFPEYGRYCDFLEAVAERTGVHPRNLYLRGSCQIGFSIAPKPTAWTAMRSTPNPSDLDLVIVDEGYFTRYEREVCWWEERNPRRNLQGRESEAFELRLQDRQFNCCRDAARPPAICIHHQDTMRRVADMEHCGLRRMLSAFIYPDWLSARRRYEFDIRQLVRGVESGQVPLPSDRPISEEASGVAPPSQHAASPPGESTPKAEERS
jgi:hypothetical protein